MAVGSAVAGGQIQAFATLAATGTVVAAVPGKRIRVYGYILNALADTQVKFQSGGSDISALWSIIARGGFVVSPSNTPWFATAAGQALNLSMVINTTVGVQVIYDLS